jgi:hypothetical protein
MILFALGAARRQNDSAQDYDYYSQDCPWTLPGLPGRWDIMLDSGREKRKQPAPGFFRSKLPTRLSVQLKAVPAGCAAVMSDRDDEVLDDGRGAVHLHGFATHEGGGRKRTAAEISLSVPGRAAGGRIHAGRK